MSENLRPLFCIHYLEFDKSENLDLRFEFCDARNHKEQVFKKIQLLSWFKINEKCISP